MNPLRIGATIGGGGVEMGWVQSDICGSGRGERGIKPREPDPALEGVVKFSNSIGTNDARGIWVDLGGVGSCAAFRSEELLPRPHMGGRKCEPARAGLGYSIAYSI